MPLRMPGLLSSTPPILPLACALQRACMSGRLLYGMREARIFYWVPCSRRRVKMFTKR